MADESRPEPRSPRRPTAFESYRYVKILLWILLGAFGLASTAMLVYSLVTSARAERASALLSGAPDSAAAKEAFALLESPHVFAGWREPDRILPPDDPVLAGLELDALVRVAVAMESPPRATSGSSPPEACRGDTACIVVALGRPPEEGERVPRRHQVFRYLMLRRAMVRGEPLSEQDLRFFRWHRTLWVHAFRAEVAGGGAAPRAQDLTLLRDLKESLAGSSRNGLVFAGYGTLVTALLAVTLLLWCRWRRPEEEEGSDRGRGA